MIIVSLCLIDLKFRAMSYFFWLLQDGLHKISISFTVIKYSQIHGIWHKVKVKPKLAMFTWCEKQAASDRCDQTKEEVREYKNYMQESGTKFNDN